jgi:hypothetical protein
MHMRVPDPLPPLCEPRSRPDPLPFVVVGVYLAIVVALLVIGLRGHGLAP